jgi:hypothetical protein
MRVTKKIQQTVEVTDDILCNRCGKSLKTKLDPEGEIYNFDGLTEGCITGSYTSSHLADMETYCFSLCEQCLVDIFKAFKIPVQTGYKLD